jgi:hypothetical protein
MKILTAFLLLGAAILGAAEPPARPPLDPRGRLHLPIGIPNTVDALKTFVEAEGNFSPGFGTCGVYFWLWEPQSRRLHAPTQDGVKCEHGLTEGGLLIPWTRWDAGQVEVRTEVCQVWRRIPQGELLVDNDVAFHMGTDLLLVVARVRLANRSLSSTRVTLLVGLRPMGAAGGPVKHLETGARHELGDGTSVVLWPERLPSRSGVLSTDTIADWALRGEVPTQNQATADTGNCSGALAYDLTLGPGETETFGFVCPVLPGRRAAGHRWDGVSTWAQFDLNNPVSPEGGVLQPAVPPQDWPPMKTDDLFAEAARYWRGIQQRVRIQLPDPRWAEAFAAIVGHAALCMNEGAPDVAVVNYNVFNRDGMYMANIFQKSGNFALAEAAIDYFLRHPFNGRVQPEADNPGQILWVMGEHWRFTRNRAWLARVYPSVRRLAAMIGYYRTTPGPHWVWDTSLDFGEALPGKQRKELKPGACDGFNPNYTEAYDIAGLRGAIMLAEALNQREDVTAWKALADQLYALYEEEFGAKLAQGYGSYCVLWPCRLYPLNEGKGFEQFRDVGPQNLTDWRYFPLARAHQGLLAGHRAAAWETLNLHLQHEQMRGWYVLDEGGPSGVGGWHHVRTRWPLERGTDGRPKSSVAMPHGWAIAEFHLLLRDSLVFEDRDKLVLLAGVPSEWFTHPAGLGFERMPTHFGPCSLRYLPTSGGASLEVDSTAPGGCILALPGTLRAGLRVDGHSVTNTVGRGILLPPGVRKVVLEFTSR